MKWIIFSVLGLLLLIISPPHIRKFSVQPAAAQPNSKIIMRCQTHQLAAPYNSISSPTLAKVDCPDSSQFLATAYTIADPSGTASCQTVVQRTASGVSYAFAANCTPLGPGQRWLMYYTCCDIQRE